MRNFYDFLKYASSSLESLERMDRYIIKSAGPVPNPRRWVKRLKHGAVGAGVGAAGGAGITYAAQSGTMKDLDARNQALETENKTLSEKVEKYNNQPPQFDYGNMNFMERLAFLVFGKDYPNYMKNLYKS